MIFRYCSQCGIFDAQGFSGDLELNFNGSCLDFESSKTSGAGKGASTSDGNFVKKLLELNVGIIDQYNKNTISLKTSKYFKHLLIKLFIHCFTSFYGDFYYRIKLNFAQDISEVSKLSQRVSYT